MKTRERMINHIHSMNIALTEEHFKDQPDEILLANCHPSDREKYASELRDGYEKEIKRKRK